MSFDLVRAVEIPLPDLHDEAARQLEICNACRYCEGFCSVFPAMTRQKSFASGDITHLANLCHNCRGCWYSCQYTPPHEFALNIPAILAEVRQTSWQDHAWPEPLARVFHQSGLAVAAVLVGAISLLLLVMSSGSVSAETDFYDLIPHEVMVAIFLPAFLLPLLVVAMGLRRYWTATGGRAVRGSEMKAAFASAIRLRNLSGGQGQGCNFEKRDRYSNARRHAHQVVVLGFMLCLAATSVATVMHYAFAMPAPYGLFSPPKLLGLSGGVLLCAGSACLALLKLKADRSLGASRVWGGEMAFVLLLFLIASSGLALDQSTGWALRAFLALHLGSVFGFFLLLPYSKMVHGFFRLAALIIEEQKKT
ncbi:tricarballylate utilization 4Fe-4S protein TcuB [Paracoccus sp. MBLB3053]|uniref:Tricarballylate utilization 4Fe-4S protein TcuB n=1 Tax=Paracoccus aurantius TaxID=3073814 RepID=A0ABU2HXS4_9RHOB|nr:tricarballylate utilization 4Fe-4S protein TcuB [Paracoccus sp. MBLB3053]MDS9469821.1 tricarballylate utilization 4Fe-4S protein TcuB [Paracoccus sp. MBLB3053]